MPLTPMLLAAAAALAWSNPGPGDFAGFAGDHLSDLLTHEVCHGSAVPLLLSVLSSDCPTLLRTQQPALASLARARSERLNLGLLSVYRTSLGGQRLFRQWSLPSYSVITLAAAGQFYVLQTSVQDSSAGERR